MLPDIVTLWVGDSLGLVERACLKSILRHGHRVSLYCYRRPEGVPEGVECRDAAELIAEDRIIFHSTGSPALFSNWFRYELQRRGLGTWADCDVYLLAPLDGDGPYLFGEDAPGKVNTAILRIPEGAPILEALIEPFDEKKVPPWLPWPSLLAAKARLLFTGRTNVSKMPWGNLGPRALTALAKVHGVSGFAVPSDVLYPVPWQNASWILDPDLRVEQRITARTVAIHLWNERIKHFKEEPAPPGSFLARIQTEGRA